jgi:branched-chain amino acid transport system substrate-binding protein
MKKFLALAAAGLCVVALAACSSAGTPSDTSSSGGGGSVTVGVVTDLSGSQGAIGTDELKGAQFAVKQINANGGIKSLGGAKLVLKTYDTQTSPDQAVTAANSAVADQVSAIMGGLTSDESIAGTAVSNRAGIPWITGASSPQITGRGFNDVFQSFPNTDQAAAK